MLSLPTRLMRSSYSGVPVTEADGAVAEAPVTETEPPAPLSRPRRRKQWGAYS